MKRSNQNASPSIRGFVFQCYQALSKCRDLKRGQSLYIEVHGDISIEQSCSIEVKHYADNLTDAHGNLWKTISNWSQDDFNLTEYEKLVLLTTQKVGPKSKLHDWNNLDGAARVRILTEIKNDYMGLSGQTGKSATISRYMSAAFKDADKLLDIATKMEILSEVPDIDATYDDLCDVLAGGIPQESRKNFVDSLLGFVFSPDNFKSDGCRITQASFNKEFIELTGKYCSGTRRFREQKPQLKDEDYQGQNDALYVKKIRAIEYDDVIQEAILEHAIAVSTIDEEFKAGTLKQDLQTFQDETLKTFSNRYRRASRNPGDDINLASQNFYDDFQVLECDAFPGRDSPSKSFRNGVVHMELDDSNSSRKWRLK